MIEPCGRKNVQVLVPVKDGKHILAWLKFLETYAVSLMLTPHILLMILADNHYGRFESHFIPLFHNPPMGLGHLVYFVSRAEAV